ncbi:hypothetical protein [Hymenobacter siberiensis]|jgi:hypothetical protein|uniref:hypothetical protein n=1 Tax=Hymenobacter siberiensis TaxID=2848396 RepID=UPI001C1E3960|nr:hypothetical protein [Hymenobacter siberiensis]MBU6120943.1 hypothetical protein [Hymenobacter siberiensis]
MKHFSFTLPGRAAYVAATALLLNACAPAQDTPTPTAGLDLSHYLAVGDTYTAGVSAGGLTRASQQYSFPNLLAQQFQGISAGAAFTQPLLEAGSGTGYLNFVDFIASGLARTTRVAGQAFRGNLIITPGTCGTPDTTRLLARAATASALPQNLGIPGITLAQLEIVGLGNEVNAKPGTPFNPYFERLLPAADSRTYLQAVTDAAATATFFTYFQGLDDLMPYVRSGGQCGANAAALPSITVMRNNARKVLDRLTAKGQPGVIIRLPALTSLPFLRAGQGLGLQARLQASFGDTARIYIEDPIGLRGAQPITNGDYVLATAIARIGRPTPVVVNGATLMLPYGRDSRNPVRDADVLDNSEELSRIAGVMSSYNNELDRLASTIYKLPILTPSASTSTLDSEVLLFNQVAGIISVAGVQYSSEVVRGNFFSLDYYTLTPRGNGLLANTIIAALNRAYRTKIPAIDVNKLPATAQ